MRRNICIFLTLFFFCFPSFAQNNSNEIDPITVGDLEKLKEADSRQRREFIVDFYNKNKEKGATDGQILNELLKLDVQEGKNSEFVKKLSALGKRYKDIEHFIKNALEEINMGILERNPGKTELLIDLDDLDTWKNVKYSYTGHKNIDEYLKLFRKDSYFSNTVNAENFQALLASCVDSGTGRVLMSFVLLPQTGYSFLTHLEGKKSYGIQTDFTGSENIDVEPIYFPFEKTFFENGHKFFGYEGTVYLPFFVQLKDKEKEGTVKAVISAEVCKNNECHIQKTPLMAYVTERGNLESSVCAKLKRQMNISPLAKKTDVALQKAFFKKTLSGEVDLFVALKISFFNGREPSVNLKNEDGLHFAQPFISSDADNMLLKFRLKNPEALKGKVDLILDMAYPGNAYEFKIHPAFENEEVKPFRSFFSFSFFDFCFAFLYGIRFLFLTPVLTAFFMLGYQAGFAPRKSEEKTVAFYDGLGNIFYFWCLICVLLGCTWIFALPENTLYWGMQFYSPLLNFFFLVLFILTARYLYKIFDDVNVILISERFPRFFSFFKAEDIREKAGLITGLVTGALLFITPMTGMYYDIYVLLSRSIILYSIMFAAGVALPFLILSLYDKKAMAINPEIKAQIFIKRILPAPLYLQAVLMAALIAMEAGLVIFAALIVLIALTILCLKKTSLNKKRILAISVLIGIVFIPLRPNEKDMNNWGSVAFDEAVLRQQVRDGKIVYLNVTESFCLSCHWNRFVMMYHGVPKESRQDLVVMRVGYNDPFLKRLVAQGGKYGLPLNILFSKAYPEGKMIDPVLNPWSAESAWLEMSSLQESGQDQRTEPEQTAPDLREKGTN